MAIIWIIGGGEETPLNVIRPCRMKVPPNQVLDMNGSLYLIVAYLIKDEYEELGI